MSRDYLTIEDVLAIHREQIERYGGSDGLRDQAALEAAVARPQSGYYEDLLDEAAALWESLSQNHPFIDGNKRTSFSAMNRFLGLNGTKITADASSTFTFIMDAFERRDLRFSNLRKWLGENTASR